MTLHRVFKYGIFLIGIDQLTKELALRLFPVSYNSGISFGIGGNTSVVFLVAVIFIIAINAKKSGLSFSDILMISGGLSNIIDRIFRGAVLDWIDLLWFRCNVADVMITTGAILLTVRQLKLHKLYKLHKLHKT